MKQLITILLLLIISCGSNTETYPDTGDKKDLHNSDMRYKIVIIPDITIPDLGPHLCSPAGYYTFHVKITQNNCPVSIVKKNQWTNSAFIKSYHCVIYFIDGYNFLDDGKILYCIYYTESKPEGLLQWAECTVYSLDGTIFCEFNFSAPFTEPDNN